MLNELDELAGKHQPTKFRMGYTPAYWTYLRDRRESTRKVLEIGIDQGGSLRLWRDFFPNAEIWGIDIDPDCRKHEGDNIHVLIGDSTSPELLKKLLNLSGGDFDIIIDDGDHYYRSQIKTFETFFPVLKMGGLYFVEDIGCSDGPHRMIATRAFMELAEGVNYWPPGNKNSTLSEFPTTNPYIRSVVGVSFYRYLCVLEKDEAPLCRRYVAGGGAAPAIPMPALLRNRYSAACWISSRIAVAAGSFPERTCVRGEPSRRSLTGFSNQHATLAKAFAD